MAEQEHVEHKANERQYQARKVPERVSLRLFSVERVKGSIRQRRGRV